MTNAPVWLAGLCLLVSILFHFYVLIFIVLIRFAVRPPDVVEEDLIFCCDDFATLTLVAS